MLEITLFPSGKSHFWDFIKWFGNAKSGISHFWVSLGPSPPQRHECEGPLFVVKRDSSPRFRMVVLNRLSRNNEFYDVNGSFPLQLIEPYLIFKSQVIECGTCTDAAAEPAFTLQPRPVPTPRPSPFRGRSQARAHAAAKPVPTPQPSPFRGRSQARADAAAKPVLTPQPRPVPTPQSPVPFPSLPPSLPLPPGTSAGC